MHRPGGKGFKMLTSKEYTEKSGVSCPECGSGDIEGGHIEVDEGGATQEIGCGACNSHWTDTYTLTGYMDFERSI